LDLFFPSLFFFFFPLRETVHDPILVFLFRTPCYGAPPSRCFLINVFFLFSQTCSGPVFFFSSNFEREYQMSVSLTSFFFLIAFFFFPPRWTFVVLFPVGFSVNPQKFVVVCGHQVNDFSPLLSGLSRLDFDMLHGPVFTDGPFSPSLSVPSRPTGLVGLRSPHRGKTLFIFTPPSLLFFFFFSRDSCATV